MTARSSRSTPRARSRCLRPTQSGAGSTMSRCIPTARWRGRPARPPLSAAARARKNPSMRPRPSVGWRLRQKACGVAVAHYNGVTLWFPNMAAKPEFLEWAGSHLAVTFSPDNKFLVTAMHEPALHGWRLADNRHMRMSGYPGRVRSMSWSAGGKGLATSGADTVIVWPFASKDGPMGKEPAMLAPLAGARLRGRLPSEAGHHGRRLQRRHRADGAARGRRGNSGAPEGQRRGVGARLERQGHAARLRRPKTATPEWWSCSAPRTSRPVPEGTMRRAGRCYREQFRGERYVCREQASAVRRRIFCSRPRWSRRGSSFLACRWPNSRARNPQQLAQATPPLQSTPGAETKPSAPAEPMHDGTRPSTPARAGAARCRGAEGRRPARAAAGAGGEDGGADQGEIEPNRPTTRPHPEERSKARLEGWAQRHAPWFETLRKCAPVTE